MHTGRWTASMFGWMVMAAMAVLAQGSGYRMFDAGGGYIENRGQWNPRAAFLAQDGNLDVWITREGFTYDLRRTERVSDPATGTPSVQTHAGVAPLSGHVVRMTFEGASAQTQAHGATPTASYRNYLLGDDPHHWYSHVPVYGDARLEHLYSGVDAHLYFDAGHPRYDLIVAPGADAAAVRMRIEGADAVLVHDDGTLAIATSAGVIEQGGLVAYQEIEGVRCRVGCRFVQGPGGVITFGVDAYDHARPLVIDPVIYTAVLSGSGSTDATALALGPGGDIFFAGYTYARDLPTTVGAYSTGNKTDTANQKALDCFIAGVSNDGGELSFVTYLGGKSGEKVTSMALDSAGNILVTGTTASTDFPVTYLNTRGAASNDAIFATAISSDGAHLAYSALISSTGADRSNGIAVDRDGSIALVATSFGQDFPVTGPALDGSPATNEAMYVMRFAPHADSLIYSRRLGGSSSAEAGGLALDRDGNVCIIGSTYSADYPVTADALHTARDPAGRFNAVATVISRSGDSILYSTYLGPTGE